MNRFLVIWTQAALDEVTAAWLAAPSEIRNAIVDAWHRIDSVLADDPENLGESRADRKRIWFEPPLGVVFKVDADKKEVRLLQVWTFKKRS